MWRMPYITSLLVSAASIATAVGVLWVLLVGLLQLPTLFYFILAGILLRTGQRFGTN